MPLSTYSSPPEHAIGQDGELMSHGRNRFGRTEFAAEPAVLGIRMVGDSVVLVLPVFSAPIAAVHAELILRFDPDGEMLRSSTAVESGAHYKAVRTV
jgi:hypothetical protein